MRNTVCADSGMSSPTINARMSGRSVQGSIQIEAVAGLWCRLRLRVAVGRRAGIRLAICKRVSHADHRPDRW